jgi:hypothetical protein
MTILKLNINLTLIRIQAEISQENKILTLMANVYVKAYHKHALLCNYLQRNPC